MRAQSLTLAAAGLALLAPSSVPSAVRQTHGTPGPPAIRQEGSVRAADLLARVRDCAPVSRGRYRTDDGVPATVPVCGTPEAVFWTADMDIDCDGRPGPHCNSGVDPLFSGTTAFTQSDGRYLSAETLPYIVVPDVSDVWNHREHGVRGGAVAAVVYRDRVQYAVVGDVGPPDIIGEASYATAEALGIRPDPHGGGTPSGVTYIVFKNSRATPIESHVSARETGERLARAFVRAVVRTDQPPEAPEAPEASVAPVDAGTAARYPRGPEVSALPSGRWGPEMSAAPRPGRPKPAAAGERPADRTAAAGEARGQDGGEARGGHGAAWAEDVQEAARTALAEADEEVGEEE